jgi:hypothetical protein
MNIGFGNGNFWQLDATINERFDEKRMQRFIIPGTNIIELHCIDEGALDYILKYGLHIGDTIRKISMHAPTAQLQYDDSEVTHRILHKIELVCGKYNVYNVVFHPDLIFDWDVLASYTNIPVSIENMDDRKDFGKSIEDIESVLKKYNFGFTVDLQHCFVNDSTMKLAQRFQNKFKDRIVEYHISGFEKTLLHYPLYKTRQNIIIEALKYKNIPIIIESVFDSFGEQYEELKYIKKEFGS